MTELVLERFVEHGGPFFDQLNTLLTIELYVLSMFGNSLRT
jgi:hypothetical protein